MTEWLRDLRYGARMLARAPAFTAVAMLSLALGIGVNTAVLAVARSVLLDPLPVPDPHRLVVAGWWRADPVKGRMNINSATARDERTGRDLNTNYDYAAYRALRDAVRGAADLFAFTFVRQANLSLEGRAATGGGMLVSGNYFSSLRVPLQLGRGIRDDDDSADAAPVAVLGSSIWQTAFGSDPSVVGKQVRINGRPFTVIGITAAGYFGVSNGGFFPPADVTVPLSAQPLVAPRWDGLMSLMSPPASGTLFTSDRVLWLRIMARLGPGADRAAVEARLSAALLQRINASSAPLPSGAAPPGVALLDGARGLDSLRASLQRPLGLLAAVSALVFLIACVNLAGLSLVRGVARRQEFWIRVALGGRRGRLVRQQLVESALLAGAGGALGVLLAVWTGRAIVALLAGSAPTAIEIRYEPWLFVIGTAIATLAALLFGLFPALRLPADAAVDYLRQAGVAPRLRAGRALVLVQIAIAVPLVVGAALFLRTIGNLARVDLGFDPDGLVQFKLDPTLNGYDEERTRRLYTQVLERAAAIPGVEGVTLVENALVSGWVSNTQFETPGGEPQSMLMNRVGPAFFETLRHPLLAGRSIADRDTAGAEPVGVLNEAAARAFFGSDEPLGRHVRMTSGDRRLIRIVGIARDGKYDSLKKPARPTVYLPYHQSTGLGAMHVMVRAAGAGLARDLQLAVAAVDPDLPVTGLKTQAQQIEETIGSERVLMRLLVAFGVFALLLACIGLHGVTSYGVARRTPEIGIRLALGAPRGSVLWLVLRQVVLLALGGLIVGIPAAAFGSRLVSAYLFGVGPADPASIAAGSAVLFMVAVGAGLIPARRAARVSPLAAIRRD